VSSEPAWTFAVWRDAGGSTYWLPIAPEVTAAEAAEAIEAAGGGFGSGYDLLLTSDQGEGEAHADAIRGKVESE
jgi:hypothetical protein